MLLARVGIALLALAAPLAGAAPLRPGERAAFELSTEPGARAVAVLQVEGPGPVTLTARSLHLDVRLAAFAEGAETPLAEDDNGLAGTDARLVLRPEGPARFRVEVWAADPTEEARGEVVLEAAAGEPPAPAPGEEDAEDDAYWAAVRARAEATGDDALRVRAALGLVGHLYARGKLEGALASAREGAALAERTFGAGDGRFGMALSDLGLMLYLNGDLGGAGEALRRAVPLIEGRFGAEDARTATVLNILGTVLHERGELHEARLSLERCLAIRERLFGAEAIETSTALGNLASILDELGDLEASLASYQRVLAIIEKVHGPRAPRLATALNNVGYALKKLGRTGEARLYYERALAIRQAVLDPEHPLLALSLQNLGSLLADSGDTGGALDLLRRALALREKVLAPDHPDLAVTLGNLARVLHDAGSGEEALAACERALTIRRAKLGDGHPDTARVQLLRARILAANGRRREALEEALAAEGTARDDARAVARFLPERLALRYAGGRAAGVEAALATALQGPDPLGAGAAIWDEVIRSRALVLDEMARRLAALRRTEAAEAVAARDRLAAAAERWARAVSGPAGKGVAEQVASASREREAAERALAEVSASYRSELSSREIGFAEVVRALPAGAALVAYVRYDRAYAALVLPSPRGEARLLALGEARAIDGLVARWREAIAGAATSDLAAARRAEARARVAGRELRARVFDPVAAHLGGASRVYLVPEGTLHLVPFAALPGAGTSYLVETGPTFQILSAERDLVQPVAETAAKGGLLALGSPTFDARGAPCDCPPGRAAHRGPSAACAGFRDLRFAPLPQAAQEVAEIARLAPGPARVLVGPEATEEAFKALAPGSRALHLATHGFVLGEGCGGPAEVPLRLAGLALSGANLRGRRDGEDGILTAEEVAALDLSSVEWVALSACDTGIGGIASGEGVLGLRRAFAVAGARILVMTLWKVDDRDARRWMKAAYTARFSRGKDAAEAVRGASREILRERRARGLDTSPFHWGGFVAAGR